MTKQIPCANRQWDVHSAGWQQMTAACKPNNGLSGRGPMARPSSKAGSSVFFFCFTLPPPNTWVFVHVVINQPKSHRQCMPGVLTRHNFTAYNHQHQLLRFIGHNAQQGYTLTKLHHQPQQHIYSKPTLLTVTFLGPHYGHHTKPQLEQCSPFPSNTCWTLT